MAVFRVEKTKDYTVMANHHLKNKKLTLKAKGLLSMMLSLPDSWDYSTRGLAAISMEGVDSIGGALKELEAAGYIVRNRLRDEKGRIKDTEYVIYETPEHTPHPELPDPENSHTALPDPENSHTALPDTENPDMDKQDMAAPDTEKPAQYNTNRSIPNQRNLKKLNTKRGNPYQSNPNQSNSQGEQVMQIREQTKRQISYEVIVDSYNRERLDEVVELIVETLCSEEPTITISGTAYPAALVKERLMSLNNMHIEYVFDCVEKRSRDIHNIKRYLLTTLFNAPITINNYHDDWANKRRFE